MWTKSGTIAVTTGGTAVVGTGTTWISTAAAGEGLVGPDGKIYEIASINSDLSLTLSSPYLGSTQTEQAYSILPTQSYIQSLASQVSTLISNYASVKDNAGAGKFPAGTQSVPGVRFASDDNTGLRSTGPDAMALVAGGVDRLLIDSAGIHGAMTASTVDSTPIGQTTAAAGSFTTMNASGQINSGSTTAPGALQLLSPGATLSITPDQTSGANGVIYNASFVAGGSGPHKFQVGGFGRAVVSASGLDVTGALSATGTSAGATMEVASIKNAGTGVNTKAQLGFYAAGTKYAAINGGYGASGPELTVDISGVKVLGVSDAGLAVAGALSAGRTGIPVVIKDNAGGDYGNDIYLPHDGGSSTQHAFRLRSSYATGFSLAYSTATGAQFSDPAALPYLTALNVDHVGHLLVGRGSAQANERLNITSSGATQGVMSSNTDTATTAAVLFWGWANGLDQFLVFGNGDVQNRNNSYGAFSDVKLKENITDATPKLAKLLQVRIVNYNLKSNPDLKQIGVIAQELEEISAGLIEETPDYMDVEVEPARTDVKTVQRQKVEQREDVRYETTLVNGQWRKLPVRTTVEVPLFQDHPLFDAAGAAIMEVAEPEQPEVLDADGQVTTPFKPATYRQSTHRVPVLEDVQETVEVPAKIERQATGEVTKSVKYSVFVPMLIKAMQEQQAMIDALTQRLDALEAA
jgi:hypothetical protein